jgi:membrane protein DedA with SNARE-associated domain
MVPELFFIATATFASEDLACIATGVLIAQGKLTFVEGAVACFAGILAGDMLLFAAGRLLGTKLLRWPPLSRFLSPEMVERGAAWLQRRGLIVILLSRFTPGLRLPTYFAAGLLPTKAVTFATYFFLASAIWTPALVGASALFGQELLRDFFAEQRQTVAAFAVVLATLTAIAWLIRPLFRFTGRRRFVGFIKRKLHWEFWPAWLAYLPLIPYLVYLGVRHRSLTLFTAANPDIPSGGFVSESKSQILSQLSRVDGAVPEFAVIPACLSKTMRVQSAASFINENHLEFPVVVKPDVGERGSGVAIVRSYPELQSCLEHAETDTIIQRYVEGLEFGVFYYRYPNEAAGRISSITAKHFPAVIGDGRSTLRELILRDTRAVCIAAVYEKLTKQPLDGVPCSGERVQLVEVGSHCRGAVFLNSTSLKTETLERAIDTISKAHPGFFFGRSDVRVPSVEALQKGESLKIIELNGVSAEPAHIYDPSISLFAAYRVMFRHWRVAFEIGSVNRARGAQPMGLWDFTALVRNRLSGSITEARAGAEEAPRLNTRTRR